MKYSVLLSDRMHSAGVELLANKCDILYSNSIEEFVSLSKNVDAIILIRKGEAFRKTIDGAEKLKVIAKHGVGLDKIDLKYAEEKEIPVVYTPDSNSIGVAEHFVTLCLMCAKKMHKSDMVLRKGKWKNDPFDFLGSEIHGKNLGILGFGRIGRQIAKICQKGFDMKIYYYDINIKEDYVGEYDARKLDLEELARVSDFISINLPLNDSTRAIVNSKFLEKMKRDAYIINVARGPIWKEIDIYNALKNNWIAGAASDVFEQEPTPENNLLFSLENFIATPHNAAHTEESMKKASIMLANDILAIFEGRKPINIVPKYMY
ncbi:Hydroxypyruvate reductase [bioreactor metagenome]|jgi:D-3-phosphoglycerate dehydrogenase|uniref:D-isomer specific 2-hydroxyacid dehydrogenase, NAD-binding n=2 Tax=root TaxID=1 RepID=A0A652ZWM1_9SPIR|nr:hydroxyacid dehydrogenase [Spirochaetia bacterium]MDX9799664.1 hydroxyacid dehydrogenase [Bacteroidales bacterium]NMC60171.1 hydroxyacid dehydrogenase [Candidatus Methanofastidiosa archaeon]VBB40140.1 D-isomer specific 2-hydroxyacid dehydrogenase, NAD-binding [uncultured Spirochaetota bacterium]HOI22312.1 hydroxyacid dehydrogenase [Spirochaetales bacterium]